MGFSRDSPIVAGTTLIRSDIRSQNFVTGVSGWIIEADGDAEFNDVTVRGDLVATGSNSSYIELKSQPVPQIIFQPPDYAVSPPTHAELAAGAIYVYNNPDTREIMSIEGPHFNVGAGAASDVYPQIAMGSPTYDGSVLSEIYMNASDSSGNLTVYIEGALHVGENATDIGRGIISTTTLIASSGFTAAEAVVMSGNSNDFKAGRAYSVQIDGGAASSAANSFADVRVRKGNSTAGQALGQYYRYPCPLLGQVHPVHGSRIFVANTNITTALCLTLQTTVGTVLLFADTGDKVFDMTVTDVGPASAYPNAPVIV